MAPTPQSSFRLKRDLREQLKQASGKSTQTDLVESALRNALPEGEKSPIKRPNWNYRAFCGFYESLELPNGRPAELEGFQRLILREIFAKNRVETLVLIPKGHAKTTLLAALAVYHVRATLNANVYIGAADRIQADEMYRFAAHFSETALEDDLKVLRGTREIRSRHDQGFIRVLASDDSRQGGKRQGFNPTLALLDEYHAHENENLYVDMRSGLFKRKGMLVTISTAGWDQDSGLGKLRKSFLEAGVTGGLTATSDGKTRKSAKGRLTVARKPSGKSSMLEWAVNSDDDDEDLAVVKLANPATWVDIASLEDARESLTPWTFKRYRANRWTLGFESWLPEGSWEALEEPNLPLSADLPTYAALDMARYRDCAALVAVQPREDAPSAVKAWIWRPGGPDDPVSYEDVKAGVRKLAEDVNLVAFAYDPKYFDQSGQELADEGLPVELFPQSNERMCPAAADLRSAIINGELAHDGDPQLTRHLIAPIVKDVGDSQFKLTKSRNNGPDIDAAEALCMAWALATAEQPVPGVVF